jgi:MFS family permease
MGKYFNFKVAGLESNIWKFFLFTLSQRRNFLPILAIYFLTLPNTTAQQIGLFSAFGALASFFLEIPSGYFSDKFGHKKTLILSKFLMACSLLCFIFGSFLVSPFFAFTFGAIFQSVGFAMSSGTAGVFMHETLKKLGKEKDFSKIFGRIQGKVSLVSAFIIILLPFLTSINIIIPLVVGLVLDVLGLFVAFSFVDPRLHEHVAKNLKTKKIGKILKNYWNLNLFSLSIFLGAITGFSLASSSFRALYVVDLGYPIIYLGFIMGLSRVVWFLFSYQAHNIEKYFTMKQFLLLEIFIFGSIYLMIAYFSNPYVISGLFILIGGYLWGRSAVTKKYLLDIVDDSTYKVTLLSICSQMTSMFNFIVAFFIGFVMQISYRFGFVVFAVSLICVLAISYIFILKNFE